jgi:hypothetical protein
MGRETLILDRTPTTRVVGVVVALSGFVIAIVAGLAVDNPADVILARALVCLALCLVVGLAAGSVCERVIADHVAAQKKIAGAPAPEAENVA